jgi:hypothetical protein
VIVNNRNVEHVAGCPCEADPPLIVDTNTVLPVSIPAELLEVVTSRRPQFFQPERRVQLRKLSEHCPLQQRWETPHALAPPQPLGISVSEASNHWN